MGVNTRVTAYRLHVAADLYEFVNSRLMPALEQSEYHDLCEKVKALNERAYWFRPPLREIRRFDDSQKTILREYLQKELEQFGNRDKMYLTEVIRKINIEKLLEWASN